MFDSPEASSLATNAPLGNVSAQHASQTAYSIPLIETTQTADLALFAEQTSQLSDFQMPEVAADFISTDDLLASNSGEQLILEADQSGPSQALSQAALNSSSGAFTVGAQGEVEIDFLFDGGQHVGELAVFSLAGMGGLSKEAFVQEATARALSGTENGQVVISDRTGGAQFSGRLGERDRNQGTATATQKLTLAAGTHFAFMLVPNGSVAALASNETDNTPFFSISTFNPGEQVQMAEAADGIFAIEDLLIGQSDADFNDLIFQVKGATGEVTDVAQVIASNKNWLTNPTAQTFLEAPPSTLFQNPTTINPTNETEDSGSSGSSSGSTDSGNTDSSSTGSTDSGSAGSGSTGPGSTGSGSNSGSTGTLFDADISEDVSKFTGNSNRSQIIASGANNITIGTQTIYIGTNQVSSNNQNPIIRSFDSTDPNKNWTRTDLETTGTDGRGSGLVWTGTALYGVFSVDGTQGQPSEDFRRATGDVQQNWLSSFGSGEGKVAVIGQIDPLTGDLLKAAYLSAVKQDGKTNSLFVTDITVNSTGNLVISAKSFFSPRQPNGNAMTRDQNNTDSSPFDYTVEMTADLTQVVSTSAPGWS